MGILQSTMSIVSSEAPLHRLLSLYPRTNFQTLSQALQSPVILEGLAIPHHTIYDLCNLGRARSNDAEEVAERLV